MLTPIPNTPSNDNQGALFFSPEKSNALVIDCTSHEDSYIICYGYGIHCLFIVEHLRHRDSALPQFTPPQIVRDLSTLGLTAYSIDLDEPEHVTVLNLAQNRLVDMPAVKRLKNLRTLILDDNLFVNMPETIFKLRTLRRLSVQRCRLTWLPAALFSYPGLEELRLDGNDMISLPCDLVVMSSLNVLTLEDNPFRDPLRSITQEGMEYTLAYLRFFYNAREFGVLDLKEMDFIEMPYESDVCRPQVDRTIKFSVMCFHSTQRSSRLASDTTSSALRHRFEIGTCSVRLRLDVLESVLITESAR